MKVVINGKEIEIEEPMDSEAKSLDQKTPLPENDKIDFENTIEVTEEMIQKIKEEEEDLWVEENK